jgi:hypothetical protein
MNLQEMTPLVESSLTGMNLDPVTCRTETPGHWTYKHGTATVWIDVFSPNANEGKWYFQVMSPLCSLPDTRALEFYKEVMEINYHLYGSWICKKDNWFYVNYLRETTNIDQSEIDATIDRVGYYCEEYKEKLSAKFEGSWSRKVAEATH